MNNKAFQERHAAALMPTYGTPPVALVHGRGCTVWDADGRQYLDLIAGIAVSSLGHAHPALVDAVTRQVGRIAHTSNLVINEPSVALAERLLQLLRQDGRVFLCNTGTEANEAAFKLARRHHGGGRSYVVAAEKSFHGRTMGALAMTGKPAIRDPFRPFATDVRFVPYGNVAALNDAVDEDCAAVFLEPTLGEGGVVPPPDGYLSAARRTCDDTGALLVLDEVQSGVGRTGAWFQHQHAGVVPDVVTLAKGLGGGIPIGACIGVGAYGSVFETGDHASTFGGNPVACAAALAVLDTIEREGLLENAVKVGERLTTGAAIESPLLAGVRGRGLWLALVLTSPAAATVTTAAREAGFLVNAVQPDAVRLAPPLVLTLDEADSFVAALPAILERATGDAA
jgi:acetylornithine/N-succinyldiaminopimelate aminotransferase